MRIPELAKKLLKFLPVLALLIATLIGVVAGKDLFPTSLDTQTTTPPQLPTEPNEQQPPIILGNMGPCNFSNLYLSLPPKCKTLEGEFIPAPGTSPYILVTPEGK